MATCGSERASLHIRAAAVAVIHRALLSNFTCSVTIGPVTSGELPADFEAELALETPIDSDTVAVGDPVMARTVDRVSYRGRANQIGPLTERTAARAVRIGTRSSARRPDPNEKVSLTGPPHLKLPAGTRLVLRSIAR